MAIVRADPEGRALGLAVVRGVYGRVREWRARSCIKVMAYSFDTKHEP